MDFHNRVCDLWKHTKGRPGDPIANVIEQSQQAANTDFALKDEVELAEGIAYITAVCKGVEQVSACAIGIPNKPAMDYSSILLRMTG